METDKWNLVAFAVVLMFYLNPLLILADNPDYLVTMDKVEPYPGARETACEFTQLDVIERERFLNGTVTVNNDLDNSYDLEMELYNSPNSDGNYQMLPMGFKKTKLCEALKKFYAKFIEPSFDHDGNTDLPYVDVVDGLCPVPAGEYWIKSVLLNIESWPNHLPRGMLKAIINISKNQISVGGANVYLIVEDKDEE